MWTFQCKFNIPSTAWCMEAKCYFLDGVWTRGGVYSFIRFLSFRYQYMYIKSILNACTSMSWRLCTYKSEKVSLWSITFYVNNINTSSASTHNLLYWGENFLIQPTSETVLICITKENKYNCLLASHSYDNILQLWQTRWELPHCSWMKNTLYFVLTRLVALNQNCIVCH